MSPTTEGQTNVVLSDARRGELLKGLQSHPGVELVAQASVTTLSGRQAEIQIEPDLPSAPKTHSGRLGFLGLPEPQYPGQTYPSPLTAQLDMLPEASADQRTVRISGHAKLSEFLGYSPTSFISPPDWDTRLVKGDAVVISRSPLFLPHFQIRELSFAGLLDDGQTLVLRGTVRGARSTGNAAGGRERELLVLITPTLILPDGTRIHPQQAQGK